MSINHGRIQRNGELYDRDTSAFSLAVVLSVKFYTMYLEYNNIKVEINGHYELSSCWSLTIRCLWMIKINSQQNI